MKKFLKISIFASLLLLLTACPYESKVPITKANKAINKTLLGNWYTDGEMDKEYPKEYHKIKAENDNTYRITHLEFDSEDSTYKERIYISHLSYLKDKNGKKYSFLNMKKKDNKYYLYRIKLNAEQFVLYELTDNIDEEFDTNEELKNFVKQNMHVSFFYNKDEVTYYKGDHKKN